MGHGVVGIEPERLAADGNCLVQLVLGGQREGEFVVGHSAPRTDRQRSRQVPYRFLGPGEKIVQAADSCPENFAQLEVGPEFGRVA